MAWDFQGGSQDGTSEIWTFTTDSFPVFSGYTPAALTGSGTQSDPWLISNAQDIGTIYYKPTGYYKLTADIDLAGITWSTAPVPFVSGGFDGNNKKIFNLTIASGSNLGLIGNVYDKGTIIKNIGMENVNITGTKRLGGLVGKNNGNISNCYSNGVVTGVNYIGGLAGQSSGSVSDCYSSADVSGGNNSSFLGGLAGYNQGIILNCRSTGAVNGGNNSQYIGGLSGYADNGYVINCYATGAVTGTSYVGGLTGYNQNGIINCYATGAVSGLYEIGGLVGNNFDGSISNCYSTGVVTGTSDFGGLVGISNDDSYISSCFFLDAGGPDNGFGEPLTDSQMKQQSNFTGWDFLGVEQDGTSEIWTMSVGGYPVLSGYVPPTLSGSGTQNDPWLVSTAVELGAIYYNPGSYFKLAADIDLAGITWSTAPVPFFPGNFNGDNKKIINLTVNGKNNLGLFGCTYDYSSNIQNLGLENVSITGVSHIGGLIGKNAGSVSYCYVTGTITGGPDSFSVGGLAGWNNNSIYYCYSSGAVSGGNNSEYIGGLTGYSQSSIESCYSVSAVSGGDNSQMLGGLVGYGYYGYINNCFATGAVSGGSNSYAVGGLTGNTYYGNIYNCYSTGSITGGTGSTMLGGLSGFNEGGTFSACFWDITTSGQSSSASGTGLLTASMKMQSTYTGAGWDCSWTWFVCEGVEYPKLRATGKYSGGSGTAGDPYKIASACDLMELAGSTNDYYGKYFILTADIDIESYGFTTAVIAPNGYYFQGSFDGNGHTISNLKIDTGGATNHYLGLFGYIYDAEIKNLRLENVSITGSDSIQYIGGLTGYCYSSDINNCISTGSINSGTNSNNVGGLVGFSYDNSSINNCSSTVTVAGGANAQYLGGLVGMNYCSISNCFYTGAVSCGDNSYDIGGLVGYEYYGNIENSYSKGTVSGTNNSSSLGGLVGYIDYGYINNCYSNCSVTGTSTIGGLVGYNGWNNSISKCFATGAVSGASHIGGFAGDNYGYIGDCYSTGDAAGESMTGGLAGYNYNTITNCYSSGIVTGTSYVGGLTGYSDGSINGCYFLNVRGPANGYGTPLTDSQMEMQASFAGWDFASIWQISEGSDYPKLWLAARLDNPDSKCKIRHHWREKY